MRRTEVPLDVLDQLRQLLVRGKFSSHVAVLASGTVLGQAAVFVVTPLLTRLYSPADLAIFGLLTSFLAVASIAVALRLELAIATTHDEGEATRLLLACLVLTPIVGLLLSGMLAAMVSLDVLSYGLLPGWSVVLTFLALVLTGWFISLRYWHVGRHEFRPVGRALILQGVARAGSTVAFGFANFAAWVDARGDCRPGFWNPQAVGCGEGSSPAGDHELRDTARSRNDQRCVRICVYRDAVELDQRACGGCAPSDSAYVVRSGARGTVRAGVARGFGARCSGCGERRRVFHAHATRAGESAGDILRF
jgi:hypothetical protein